MYEAGTVVGGRYRLIEQVGEGGMATIWKAEHLTLGSPVAVKFLHTQGGRLGRDTRERFLREARVAASVRHRNVIEITDFGVTDEEEPYMVLELLEGESLADRLARVTVLEPAEAARILSLVLRGLSAVHDAGIVHRDLKPENIFLVADADGTFPKLLDFGVSRKVEGLTATHLTQEGILVGTPDYMSLEQARGLRDIDHRTDIYSAGVILYECLTGRLPFESDNVGDLIVMITTADVTPVTVHRPSTPESLTEVVTKAMQRDRAFRYQDVREMRQALSEAIEEFYEEPSSGLLSISEHPRLGSQPRISRQDRTTQPGATPTDTSTALGTPPRMAGHGAPSQARGSGRLIGTVLLLGAVAAGAYVFLNQGNTQPPPPSNRKPEPWLPRTAGLPPWLLDAGVGEGGKTVAVRFATVPDGGVVRIEGVPIHGDRAELPRVPSSYTLEVTRPDGAVLWRVRHPGVVDGEYQVVPMSAEALRAEDGGVPADAAQAEEAPPPPPPPEKKPRRRRRRHHR